jgi:hypothetical protein
MICCSPVVAMNGYARRRSKAKFVLIGNRNANVVSMSAPVVIHLGDLLPSAATGKSGLHKSANKEDLSAAKGQEFSNLLLAAQEKGSTTASSTQAALEKAAQDLKADEAPEAESVEDTDAEVASSVSLPTLSASLPTLTGASLPTLNPGTQPLLSPHTTSSKDAKDSVESASEAEKSKTTAKTEKAEVGTDDSSQLLGVPGKDANDAVLLAASLPVMLPTTKLESTAVTGEKGEQDASGGTATGKVVLGSAASDKAGTERAVDGVSSAAGQGHQVLS